MSKAQSVLLSLKALGLESRHLLSVEAQLPVLLKEVQQQASGEPKRPALPSGTTSSPPHHLVRQDKVPRAVARGTGEAPRVVKCAM